MQLEICQLRGRCPAHHVASYERPGKGAPGEDSRTREAIRADVPVGDLEVRNGADGGIDASDKSQVPESA